MSFLVCKISAGLHICNRLISMYYNNTIIVGAYSHSDKELQYSAECTVIITVR